MRPARSLPLLRPARLPQLPQTLDIGTLGGPGTGVAPSSLEPGCPGQDPKAPGQLSGVQEQEKLGEFPDRQEGIAWKVLWAPPGGPLGLPGHSGAAASSLLFLEAGRVLFSKPDSVVNSNMWMDLWVQEGHTFSAEWC